MDFPLPENLCDAWQEFLADEKAFDHIRVSDRVFANPTLMPLQRKCELNQMLTTAAITEPRVVMEIGADKGGGLFHWCCLPTVKRVVGIEIRGTPYADLFRAAFPHIEFLFIPASSYSPETIRTVREFLDADKFDCIFLDGEKCAFDKDFAAYYPMMRSGGIVFMHDVYGEAPPAQFFQAVSAGGNGRMILDTSEGEWAKAREANGIPVEGMYEEWLRYWADRPTCGVGVIQL